MDQLGKAKLRVWAPISVCLTIFLYTVGTYPNPAVLYLAPDSLDYLQVGKWLLGKAAFSDAFIYIPKRSWPPALFLSFFNSIHPSVLQVIQIILWVLSQVFFSKILLAIIGLRKRTLYLALALQVSLISPILLTMFALSETLATFLLMSSFLFLIRFLETRSTSYMIFLSLSTVLLVTTKVQYCLGLILPTYLAISHLRQEGGRIGIFVKFLICLTPLILQIAIMRTYFSTYTPNIAGIDTFYKYYYPYVISAKENISPIAARARLESKALHATNQGRADLYEKFAIKEVLSDFRESPQLFASILLARIMAIAVLGSNYVTITNHPNLLYMVSQGQSMLLVFLLALNVVLFLRFTFIEQSAYGRRGFLIWQLMIIQLSGLAAALITAGQGDRFLMQIGPAVFLQSVIMLVRKPAILPTSA